MKKFTYIPLSLALLGTLVVQADHTRWEALSKGASTYDKNGVDVAPTDMAKAAAVAAGLLYLKNGKDLEATQAALSKNKGAIFTGVASTALIYSGWIEAALRQIPVVGGWCADRICDNKECTGACYRCKYTKGTLATVITFFVGPYANRAFDK